MSTILWVEIEGFYVDHHDSSGKPLIVAREKRVLDANALARKRGVRLGMEVRQAKAVVSECMVQNWEMEPYQPRRNAWLDVCTDFTGVIEPIDQHIAALDLSGHPNPLDVTERIVRQLVSQTKLNVHYGAAPSVWIAKLAADRDDLGRAMESPSYFLASLPVSDLLPVSNEARNRLEFLGYRTIGEVANLPLATLQGQFGEESLVILASAQGRHYQPVHALYPMDSLRECLIFDGAVADWETIDHGLQKIAERVGRRLSEKGMQGSKLALKVEMEESVRSTERRFTKPIHNPLTALIALRMLIQEVSRQPVTNVEAPAGKHVLPQPRPCGDEVFLSSLDLQSLEVSALNSPVVGIQLSLTDLEKTRHRQQELAGFSLRSKRPDVASAVGYVRTVFGENSVKLGSEIELPRRVRVLKEWQNATGWR